MISSHKDRFSCELQSAISDTATTCFFNRLKPEVSPSDEQALWPSISATTVTSDVAYADFGKFNRRFFLVFEDKNDESIFEIVQVVFVQIQPTRVLCNIQRGFSGTTARAWSVENTRVESRFTSADFERLAGAFKNLIVNIATEVKTRHDALANQLSILQNTVDNISPSTESTYNQWSNKKVWYNSSNDYAISAKDGPYRFLMVGGGGGGAAGYLITHDVFVDDAQTIQQQYIEMVSGGGGGAGEVCECILFPETDLTVSIIVGAGGRGGTQTASAVFGGTTRVTFRNAQDSGVFWEMQTNGGNPASKLVQSGLSFLPGHTRNSTYIWIRINKPGLGTFVYRHLPITTSGTAGQCVLCPSDIAPQLLTGGTGGFGGIVGLYVTEPTTTIDTNTYSNVVRRGVGGAGGNCLLTGAQDGQPGQNGCVVMDTLVTI